MIESAINLLRKYLLMIVKNSWLVNRNIAMCRRNLRASSVRIRSSEE